ncbi:hypothetical protein Tco_0937768 [Tanacetum coccineum]|uniref:Uncharacterized protein n=1 Tax=Tanacetum coccineum TaxID=301880 RepID=A0ABQ5DHY7_9ASTR
MSASMEARIAEHAAAPIPPTSPAYNQAPLGHRAAIICMRDDIPRRTCYLGGDLYLLLPHLGLIHSPGHDAQTIARAADRVENVGYVHRKESKDFYTQLHDARTDRRDIRLEIDIRVEDDAVRQMMRTHVLEARAQIDTVEDTGSSC